MAITPLPIPPSRQDPANFNTRADAFLGALPAFVTEANQLQTEVNTKVDSAIAAGLSDAADNATTASTKAAEAASSAAEALSYLQAYRATSYGALPSDPTIDPNGNPPTVGDEYFNTSMNLLKRFNGSTWQASDIATADLAAPGGAALVGYDGGTARDVLDEAKPMQGYTALRSYTGRATGVRITQAGIAGFFQRDVGDTTSADNGGTIIVDASGRRWKRLFSGGLNVQWFGVKFDGSDDSASIVSACNAANSGASTFRCVEFPAGVCSVSNVSLSDIYDLTFAFNGTIIKGIATAASDAVFKITNAYNVNTVGSFSLDGMNRANYDSLFYITAAPGGAIDPAKGVATRINVNGLTTYNAKLGVKVGEYNNDAQIAEITFNGLNSAKCPGVAHVSGSQAGVLFVGGNITSEPNAAFPGASEFAVRNEGSFVSIASEITLTNSTNQKTIWMNPAQSAAYGNPYGITRINGGHIESASPLCYIDNPRGLAAPYSAQSQFSCVGSGGFASSGLNNSNFIEVADSSYVGRIQVSANNFYGQAGNVRNAFNVGAAPGTLVETDRSSWGAGFKDWMGGVNSGVLRHPLEQVVFADNLNNLSIANGATTTLVFAAKATTGQFARYAPAYNAATGVFTVPDGGLKSLRISAVCSATSGTPSGNVAIYRNGAIDTRGVVSGGVLSVFGEFFDVPAGTEFSIRFTNASGAPVGFGVSGGDKLTIFAAN